MEIGFCQWCPAPEQEAMGTNQHTEAPSEHQAALLVCVGDRALAQTGQRLRNLLLGDIRSHMDKVLGTLLWESLLGEGLEQRNTEVSANLSQP